MTWPAADPGRKAYIAPSRVTKSTAWYSAAAHAATASVTAVIG
jgi:hypothetical protein